MLEAFVAYMAPALHDPGVIVMGSLLAIFVLTMLAEKFWLIDSGFG